MPATTRPATIWVGGTEPRKRHLLDCDYFDNPKKLRRATEEQMKLPQCQWCVDRMHAAVADTTTNIGVNA